MVSIQSNLVRPICSPGASRQGFTLVEILIVVVILGILAAIVMPQFSNAAYVARENTLKDDLRYLRMQIIVYKAQHCDAAPGYPVGDLTSPDAGVFLRQMTRYTNEAGSDNASHTTEYRFRPYLGKMPPNPLNSKDTMLIVANGQPVPVPTGTYGWIYKAQTQEIIADLDGADSDGKSYADY